MSEVEKDAVVEKDDGRTTKKPKEGAHLVELRKGGETIKVHPSCIEAHKRQGWAQE